MVRSASPRSSPPCRPICYLITSSRAPRSRRCGPGSRMGSNRRPAAFPRALPGRLSPTRRRRLCSPRYPAVQFPKEFNELRIRDYSSEPPIEGAAYPVFVTACDADGNGIGGVRHPLVAVPVGTHVGWQIRRDGYAGGDLFNLFGAFIPFAETKAERLLAGDPRPSLEERYSSLDNWADRLAAACTRLVEDRLLLEEDVPALIDAARKSWSVFDAI